MLSLFKHFAQLELRHLGENLVYITQATVYIIQNVLCSTKFVSSVEKLEK